MTVKLLGSIKLFIGLSAMIGGILLLYPLLQENADKTDMLIGNVIGFTMVEIYGLYIVYSGWSEFQDSNKLKRRLIWSGVGGSVLMFLVMLWVLMNDTSEGMGLGGTITLGLILLVGIRDMLRLKRKKTTLSNSKEQTSVV